MVTVSMDGVGGGRDDVHLQSDAQLNDPPPSLTIAAARRQCRDLFATPDI
jgi:hypothetical protein